MNDNLYELENTIKTVMKSLLVSNDISSLIEAMIDSRV